MKYEIINLNTIITDETVLDNKDIFITNINLMDNLSEINLPIEKSKSLKQILNFLQFFISNMNEKHELAIHSNTLIKHFNRNTYKQFKDLLQELDIMYAVPYQQHDNSGKQYFYKKGSKNTLFKLTNKFLNNVNLCLVLFERKRKRTFVNGVKNLDKRFVNTIKNTEINYLGAIKAELDNYSEKKYTISRLKKRLSVLFSTRTNRFIKTGNKVDRIYHSFSNLSKISRRFIKTEMVDLDIVNCQPLLLIAYLNQNAFLYDQSYKNDCEEGKFYERFYDLFKTEKDTEELRKYVKVNLYSSIFFDFKPYHKFNKRFKELYPKTWDSLNKINEEEETLASRLQNIEAELFNKLNPKESKFFFILFDAIYFSNSRDILELNKNIKSFFNKFDIKVKIK